jgi:integrase
MSETRIPKVHVLASKITWKNKFDNEEWIMFDPFTRQFYTEKVIISGVNALWNRKYKEWILSVIGDGFTGEHGSIQVKYGSLTAERGRYRRFAKWGSKYYPNTDLRHFTSTHVNEFFSEIFNNPVGNTKMCVMALKSLRLYAASLNKLIVSFSLGKISDGITDRKMVPNGKKYIHPFFVELAELANIDLHDWAKGSSFGKVPIHIAMALLGHAIETIRSPKAKLTTQLFRWADQMDPLKENDNDSRGHRVRKLFSFITAYNNYHQSGVLSLPILNKFSLTPLKLSEQLARKDKYIKARYQDHLSHSEALLVLEHKTGHRSNATKVWQHDYSAYLSVEKWLKELYPNGKVELLKLRDVKYFVSKDLRNSVLTILLCLTGARSWSEIAKMSFDDIELEFGVTKFSTPITKTNHGIVATRHTTSLAFEAVSVLRSCVIGDFGKEVSSHCSIFTCRVGKFNPEHDYFDSISSRQLMLGLSDFYQRFIINHPEFYAEHKSISAHQFRHTWAEFALRRFEGDVQEVIRVQFMHSFGSEMTNQYSFGKLEPEVRDTLVRTYLKEVLFKIAEDFITNDMQDDFLKEFQGKAINVMSRSLKAQVCSEEDIEDWVTEQSHNYIQIQAHEYGYCLLHKDYIAHAKCYDDATSIAMVGAASFSDCSGCVNFAAHKGNNLAAIKRQAIAHQSNVNRMKKRYPHFSDQQPLIKASNDMVIQASQIIKQWKI